MEINNKIQRRLNHIKEKCEEIKPLVVIQCITYNHDQYIRDALEGFVSQKTAFPFVAIVHDDASTDKTAEIIREYEEKYPDIILPIYEIENQYSKRSLERVMRQACSITGAKYMAMCEGDDYWTDPLKLQKQFDFLESNHDYGMCYGKVKRYNQKKGEYTNISGGPHCSFNDIIRANQIPTLTTFFRANLLFQYETDIKPSERHWKMGDKPLWLWISMHSKIHFFDDVLGVYRILPNSASHSSDFSKWLDFAISGAEIDCFFLDRAHSHDILEYDQAVARYKYLKAYETGILTNVGKLRKDLIKNYKFQFNRYAILDTGLLIFPRLSTFIIKKMFLYKNRY